MWQVKGTCMRIDHIGYAVKDMEKARQSFEQLGYQFEEIFHDVGRNVKIQFGELDGYRIELISRLDKSKDSPVDSFLIKLGPTPYHICYKSKNLEKDMELLENNGFRTTIPPMCAMAFGDKRVVFMMNLAVGLIEIVEEQ